MYLYLPDDLIVFRTFVRRVYGDIISFARTSRPTRRKLAAEAH